MPSKSSNTSEKIKDKIIENYIDYVLTERKDPASIYAFTKGLKLSEADFYVHFSSFNDIDNTIWHNAASHCISSLKNSEEFKDYTSREKILGLFYTLIEVLNSNRSYFIYSLEKEKSPLKTKEGLKFSILEFSKEVVNEGLADKQLENRKYISEKYHQAIWLNVNFILSFWVKDDSKGFEKTDAAIEKSVNLLLELMGKSALDGFLDLGKFLYQNRFKPDFKF
jgi:hypothetical protein